MSVFEVQATFRMRVIFLKQVFGSSGQLYSAGCRLRGINRSLVQPRSEANPSVCHLASACVSRRLCSACSWRNPNRHSDVSNRRAVLTLHPVTGCLSLAAESPFSPASQRLAFPGPPSGQLWSNPQVSWETKRA